MDKKTKKHSIIHMVKDQYEVATKLGNLLVERIARKQEQLGLSDQKLGDLAFTYVTDRQKKVNNLKHGKRQLTMADYYLLCQAVGLQPDRVLSLVLDDLEDAKIQTDISKESVA
ncbi:hypothetical protein GO013_07380 [Pseudodesulfovibrio sp. JC047]|uniref:hypothetical protein n=1 Tax=Pseudodesulfovibrio sp. JC047 TaxID=2683199 RepID=UPI0013D805EB|nr:hypothetical protein [Pseudodesulfovibrio sp. JC047]NDV19240.1 hypothetical protein [Pseudodesulfovibrio sp. JC047]